MIPTFPYSDTPHLQNSGYSFANRSFYHQKSPYSSKNQSFIQPSKIDQLDKKHYAHQQDLRGLINQSMNISSQSIYPNQLNPLSEYNNTYSSPQKFPLRRRNLSEIPENHYSYLNRTSFVTQPFSTEQKKYLVDINRMPKVSDFHIPEDSSKKNILNYDTIIKPNYDQNRPLSFLERRRNFNLQGHRKENDPLENNAYFKKLRESFTQEYLENQKKLYTEQKPHYEYFNQAYSNLLLKNSQSQAPYIMPPELNKTIPAQINNMFDFRNTLPSEMKQNNRVNQESMNQTIDPRINERSYSPAQFEPVLISQQPFLRTQTQEPHFTGKDSNILNQDRETRKISIANSQQKPKEKVNLMSLPLLVQDFVVLIEYDNEIEKAKQLLKSNPECKLPIFYKVMKKTMNSNIECKDFALLVHDLKLNLKEENISDLIRRFSKTESLKLKFYDLIEMFGIPTGELAGEDIGEEDFSLKTKQLLANYLKILLNREREHKKFRVSISHNQNTLDLFKELDHAKKGYLVPEDIRLYLNSYEIMVNSNQAGIVSRIYNRSNSGRINYNEFLSEINS